MVKLFSTESKVADNFWAASPAPSGVADTFWAASPAPSGGASTNCSASGWPFETLLEEVAAGSADCTNPILKNIVASNQDVGRVANDEVVEIEAPEGHSDRPVPVDPKNLLASLEEDLDIAAYFTNVKGSSSTSVSSREQSDTQGSSSTSVSSREQSDTQGSSSTSVSSSDGRYPFDAKRMKRTLSNRESARRSRSKEKSHLSELEAQVSQIREEKSSLLKRRFDIALKYHVAVAEITTLKAQMETLIAKKTELETLRAKLSKSIVGNASVQ